MAATLDFHVASEKNTERIDLRVPISWLKRAADRKGLKLSQYIRMVVTEKMDTEGIPKPKQK